MHVLVGQLAAPRVSARVAGAQIGLNVDSWLQQRGTHDIEVCVHGASPCKDGDASDADAAPVERERGAAPPQRRDDASPVGIAAM